MKLKLFLIFIIVNFIFAIDIGDLTDDELNDLIDHFSSNAINLNTANAEEIYILPFIDKIDVYKIIVFRNEKNGINRKSLKKIIDTETYDNIKNLISFKDIKNEKTKILLNLSIKGVLEKSRGFKDSIYIGDRNKCKQKVQFSHKLKGNSQLDLRFLAKKDPGEIEYTDDMKVSASFTILHTPIGLKSQVILGNYSIFTPSELIFKNSSMFTSKLHLGRNTFFKTVSTNPSSDILKGVDGIFSKFTFRNNQIVFFYGNRKFTSTINDYDKVSSLSSSGYHRTITEIEKKDNLKYNLSGISYQFQFPQFNFYISSFKHSFSKDFTEKTLNKKIFLETFLNYEILKNTFLSFNMVSNLEKQDFMINLLQKNNKTKYYLEYKDLIQKKYTPFSENLFLGPGDKEKQVLFTIENNSKTSEFKINISTFFDQYKDFEGIYSGGIIQASFTVLFDKKFKLKISGKLKGIEDSDSEFKQEKSSGIKLYFYSTKNLRTTLNFQVLKSDSSKIGTLLSQTTILKLKRNFSARFSFAFFDTPQPLYSSEYTLSIYPFLQIYSKTGFVFSFFISKTFYKNFIISGGYSRKTYEFQPTSGSSYDKLDTNISNTVEIDLKYVF